MAYPRVNKRRTDPGAALLLQLREHTRREHRALERQPLLRALLTPGLTAPQYRQLLQALSAFYQALEARLLPAVRPLLARAPSEYDYQPRAPLLRADLADIGAVEPAVSLSAAGPWSTLDAGTSIGVLYVLEGATQGGRLIGERLRQSLELSAHFGARYFNLHTRADSWSAFRGWIAQIEPQQDREAALRGARATFSGLHAHLDHWQVHSIGR